jgi:protein PhnA
MTIEQDLHSRSESKCELCGMDTHLDVVEVPPVALVRVENCILACATCRNQIDASDTMEIDHWRCLNDSMWNPNPAVQVMAWRLLKQLEGEGWAQSALDMMYLDEETQVWAASGIEEETESDSKDSNGATLNAGDSVTLIKDLEVKGAGFTAKRGTMVKNISLTDNPKHIEGRVNGTRIVLLTAFLKRA